MTALAAFLRRRWPALALVASLVLNGFLGGMILADWMKPHRGFTGERMAGFELRRFDERLSEQAVETIAAELRPLAPELDERIKRVRAIREEIMRLAAQPEPDGDAIDGRLAELRSEAAAMQEEVQRATYNALLRLSAGERAGLAHDPG
jgi:uncharacterized membrane protein